MSKIIKMKPDSVKRSADCSFKFELNASMIKNIKNIKAIKEIIMAINEVIKYDEIMFVDLADISEKATDNLNTSTFVSIGIELLQNKLTLQNVEEYYKELNIEIPPNLTEDMKIQYLKVKEDEFDIKKKADITAVNERISSCFDRMLDIILYFTGCYDKKKREEYPELKQRITNKYFYNSTTMFDILDNFIVMINSITDTIYSK